jgi:dihydroorotate dehydrogenase electron transfer subunit
MMLEIAKVTANSQPMKGAHLLWLEAPGIASQAKPGQFVMVRCGENDEHPLRRPFSVHQREGSKIALLFNVLGGGTQWLSQRKSGDEIDLLGPLGNSFSINPGSQNLLLVAGGIGIAPLRFLADEAVKQRKNVTLLMGASSAVHLLPTEPNAKGLLTEGVLPFNITIAKVTEDGSEGFKGLATDVIVNYLNRIDQVHACGPVGMYQALVKYSNQFPKLKSTQISLEVRMGCGLGVCYGCTVKTKNGLKQACKDGPVFELNNILWDTLTD